MYTYVSPGGFEVGNSRDIDLTPAVERSIATGQPVMVVAINYRVNGHSSPSEIGRAVTVTLQVSAFWLERKWPKPESPILACEIVSIFSTRLQIPSHDNFYRRDIWTRMDSTAYRRLRGRRLARRCWRCKCRININGSPFFGQQNELEHFVQGCIHGGPILSLL